MGLPLPGSAASVLFPCGSSVRQQDVQQSGHFGGVHGVVLTDTPMDADKLAAARARRARGESPAKIAKALGVSRASIYRHLTAASE